VRVKDPLKAKHLKKALESLAEEGVTQLFRPTLGADFIVGAVGQLQFEVMADRLREEYQLDVIFEPSPFAEARWILGEQGRPRGLHEQAPLGHGDRHRRAAGVPGQVRLGDRLRRRALSQGPLRALENGLTLARVLLYGAPRPAWSRSRRRVQVSPMILARGLAAMARRSADRLIVLAPGGTIERDYVLAQALGS
jgi:hypothetical protein